MPYDLPNHYYLLMIPMTRTSIFYSHSDPISLISVLNNESSNVDCWMKANKLSVNITKQIRLFSKSRNKKFCTDIPLIFNGNPIS